MGEDPVVLATYALVLATALLVVVTAIPAVQRVSDVRASRASKAAQVVPDMNILSSRLRTNTMRALRVSNPTLQELDKLFSNVEIDQKATQDLISPAFGVGLKFVNEIYIVKHFLTCVEEDLAIVIKGLETGAHKSVHDLRGGGHHHSRGNLSPESRLTKIAANYQAAFLSLNAAEKLLPKSTRTVDQKSFWDRYSSTVDSRANQAEKDLVDMRTHRHP